ncbi:MAG: hypothetical protein IT371_01065 [Deltaproteobacteria bacterium]|nr:hypothetical protein [Deltaproteobacteria bacterium]
MPKRHARTWIVVAGALLVLLAAGLLWQFGRTSAPRPEAPEREAPSAARSDPGASRAKTGASAERTSPPRERRTAPTPAAASSDPATDAAARAPALPSLRPPAPAAVPSEIAQETDPAKRAQLLKMHERATAQIRLSVLRRRTRLLDETLARARASGQSSPEQLRRLEGELLQLKAATSDAETALGRMEATDNSP